MAAQTPDANSLYDVVIGNVRQEIAKFASVATGDTYKSGLTQIISWSWDTGSTTPSTAITIGTGANSGTVTFVVASGPAVNTCLVLTGF